MELTTDQTLDVISAGVLLGRCAEALMPFEEQLVAEVCRRFVDHKRDTVITAEEWPVIERSIAAMRRVVEARRAERISPEPA